jgi:hypothetical protein
MGRYTLLVLVLVATFGCRKPGGAADVDVDVGTARLGASLFAGERPLSARIVGHEIDLPQVAVRCTNCHRREAGAGAGAGVAGQTRAVGQTSDGIASSRDFAPALGPERLMRAMPRRGGPPSGYDRSKLCRLLRDGIDPAFVMIPQTMPRYVFTDQECEALWEFLTCRNPA